MRKIYLLLLLVLTISISAQNSPNFFKTMPYLDGTEPQWATLMYSNNPNVHEVIRLYEAHYKTHEFQKNIHTQNYKHWLKNIGEYLTDQGFIQSQNSEKEQWVAQLKQKRQAEALQKKDDIWTPMGPFETYADDDNLGVVPVSWQVNVYCLDQSVSNPNVLYAGTEGQGAWKTTDKGLNWTFITKNEDIRGVQDIKVAATDENLVFLVDNSRIYRSTDGGTTWESIYSINGSYQIVIHPTNPDIVFVVGQNGLHKTTNGGDTWTQQYSDKFWDINFHPTKANILYTLRHNPTLEYAEFWKSTDTGTTWTQINNGWYNPVNANFNAHKDYGALIAVTPLEPSKVYVGMMGNHKSDDNIWIGVYRSENEGESWINPIQDGGPYNTTTNQNLATINRTGGFSQTFYDFGFDASHTQAGKLYLGVLSLSVSSDGGNSWTRIGGYDTPAESSVGWFHPDIQDIHVLGSDVWVATDGGINYSNDEFATHESRKRGLAGAHYWGFDQGWNEDVSVGGRYHNGNTALYEVYGTGNSSRLGGGEAPTGYVDLLNPLNSYFSDISNTQINPSTVGKQSYTSRLGKYPHESYFHAQSSEIVRDPRYAHHLYMGTAVDDQNNGGFWKSTDNGSSFELLHNFGSSKVTGIEISRQNPDLLYCVYGNTQVYKTLDGGRTWNPTTSLPSNGGKIISINPSNDQELWVFAHTHNNSNKVFRTLDGGETWQNKTTPTLEGHRINDGLFQGGSPSARVYIVSSYGLFYWDSTTDDWIDYHAGLPFVMGDVKHIFKPFYRDSKIRLSSVMGVWEAPFKGSSLPIAQPMTSSDIVYCSRDTVQFDCYSILNHADATWEWSFSPEPLWVSSTTARNPKVLLQDQTAYDVTLTITDGNGFSDSKTIAKMVTVESACEAETQAGLALKTSGYGDWVQIPSLPFTSNTVTMTAWVKPDGIQSDYSSIVMNDGTTAGFNFREGNNTLGYHWPGGAWWWDSNLIVAPDEWSHVALVATPNSLMLCVNGVCSTHNTNLEAADFGSLKISSYKAWGGRTYLGLVDEVCIWNRALTQDEIREIRHLTRIPSNDSDLMAYYQFNDVEKVLDRAFVHHANMVGNAQRVPSTAPIGGGVSHRTNINEAGTYDFGETGAQLTFPSNATYPNGEIVVSRLDVLPNTIPAENAIRSQNLLQYWIVNSYGTNANFSALEDLQFSLSTSNHALQSVRTADQVQVYQRPSNSDLEDWQNTCSATDFSLEGNGTFTFGESCNIDNFGQFFLTTPTLPVRLKATLEGAYLPQTATMSNALQNAGLLPLQQPYHTAPWNYLGNEQVAEKSLFPSNLVDWVLVEVRDATDEQQVLARKAALLLGDGTVRDVDALEGVYFGGLEEGKNYRFAIRHRNHLAVMSATSFSLPNAMTYDFSLSAEQALGQNQLKEIAAGVFALPAGDVDGNSVVTVADYNLLQSQLATMNLYRLGDVNLDGQVTVEDYNLYVPNRSLIGRVR